MLQAVHGEDKSEEKWKSLLENLAVPPSFTSLRVNCRSYDVKVVLEALQQELQRVNYELINMTIIITFF